MVIMAGLSTRCGLTELGQVQVLNEVFDDENVGKFSEMIAFLRVIIHNL
jgi:hypothetical protein